MSHPVVLSVPADLGALRQIAPWVATELDAQLTSDQIDALLPGLELAVQEVAVNIVEHGYDGVEGATLSVELVVAGAVVEVVLVDTGATYQADEIEDPLSDEPQIGGYGLMIVRQLASEFSVERVGDTNRTRMCFDIPLQPAS